MLINLELRALDFQPDLVIVYEAINDMRCALYNRGGPVTRDNLQWRAQWPVDRPSSLEQFLSHSRTYLLWRRYMTDYVSRRADLGFYAITNYDPAGADMYAHYATQDPIPELGFANYRRNLNNIVSVCVARGAQVLIVTQALARWHLDSAKSRNEQIDAFDRIQDIQREVAAERGIPLFECARIIEAAAEKQLMDRVNERCSADAGLDRKAVEASLRVAPYLPDDLYFRHEVHPHDSGSDLIAHTIATYLLASPLLAH
jgi:hypothetical protein